LAGAAVGNTIGGPLPCSKSAITTAANGEITAISGNAGIKTDNSVAITITAKDTYVTDINGFGSSSFGPSAKVFEPGVISFRNGSGELQIARPRERIDQFVTLGMLADGTLCFFAAKAQTGQPRPATGQTGYLGIADGLVQTPTYTGRLFGSPALLNLVGQDQYDLTLDLSSTAPAFESQAAPRASLGKATARITLRNGIFEVASLSATEGFSDKSIFGTSGPGAFTGEVFGDIGGFLNLGATFVFVLTGPDGAVIWGVIAAEGNSI
jgi:hypothetical protein